MNTTIVDADAHVTEPPDLWERYIDPEYRHLAMRLTKDDQGWNTFRLTGKSRLDCSFRAAPWAGSAPLIRTWSLYSHREWSPMKRVSCRAQLTPTSGSRCWTRTA